MNEHPQSIVEIISPAASGILVENGPTDAPTVSHTSPSPFGAEQVESTTQTPYVAYAQSRLPYWLTRLTTALPASQGGSHKLVRFSPRSLADLQANAMCVAILLERRCGAPGTEFEREAVRCALIHWQLALDRSGRPLIWRSGRYILSFRRAIYHLLHLLNETSGFENALLRDDIRRHLQWLTQSEVKTNCTDGLLTCALAEGAVLLGEKSFRASARSRLAALLNRQTEEGWFRWRGTFDLRFQFRLLDPLARLFHDHEMLELEIPLRRLLGFLNRFIDLNGRVGGCCVRGGSILPPPYGLERLASSLTEATPLTSAARDLYARAETCGRDRPSDATTGASVSLATTLPLASVHRERAHFGHCLENVDLSGAGVATLDTSSYHAIVNYRAGGAIHVTWRNEQPDLCDAGVTVISRHHTLTSNRSAWRTDCDLDGGVVSVSGFLSRSRPESRVGRRMIMGMFERLAHTSRALAVDESLPRRSGLVRAANMARDRYRRTITLTDHEIRIVDEVHCRLPSRAVVCQSPWLGDRAQGVIRHGQPALRTPLVVDGGRVVRIERIYRDGRLLEPRSS